MRGHSAVETKQTRKRHKRTKRKAVDVTPGSSSSPQYNDPNDPHNPNLRNSDDEDDGGAAHHSTSEHSTPTREPEEEKIFDDGKVWIPNPDQDWILSKRGSGKCLIVCLILCRIVFLSHMTFFAPSYSTGYANVHLDKYEKNRVSRKIWKLKIGKTTMGRYATARQACNAHPQFKRLKQRRENNMKLLKQRMRTFR